MSLYGVRFRKFNVLSGCPASLSRNAVNSGIQCILLFAGQHQCILLVLDPYPRNTLNGFFLSRNTMIPGIQCILGALDLDSQNTLKIFPGWLLQKPMYYPFLGPGSNNTLKIPPPGWLTSASNFQRLIDKPKKTFAPGIRQSQYRRSSMPIRVIS